MDFETIKQINLNIFSIMSVLARKVELEYDNESAKLYLEYKKYIDDQKYLWNIGDPRPAGIFINGHLIPFDKKEQ